MINVVIPMAGLGKRFRDENYTTPKPFIKVFNKILIEWSLDSLRFDNQRYIFIVRNEHLEEYPNHFNDLYKKYPNCVMIPVSKTTEGQASSVYLAKEYIDNNIPLFIANCDQFIEWDLKGFQKNIMGDKNIDGSIITFTSNNPAYSYAKLGPDNKVIETAEKKPISEHSTVGFYYWNQGQVFVKSYEQMYQKDIRVNNEFYVCPVYNETLNLGHKNITIFPCKKMWPLGVPQDLKDFEKNYKHDC